MKIFCLLCFFIFQQYSSATVTSLVGFVPLCMTVTQLNTANQVLCGNQKTNTQLWEAILQCHRPIDDEFLRASNEATCPEPKVVANPEDTNYPISDVFFNICGLVNGTYSQMGLGQLCLAAGHVTEVLEVQKRWGADVPCNIGKCVKKVFADNGLDLGLI